MHCKVHLHIASNLFFKCPKKPHCHHTNFKICNGVHFANLPPSLSVKELWKSVNIWGSCGQEFNILFFDSQCISIFDVIFNTARLVGNTKRVKYSMRRFLSSFFVHTYTSLKDPVTRPDNDNRHCRPTTYGPSEWPDSRRRRT